MKKILPTRMCSRERLLCSCLYLIIFLKQVINRYLSFETLFASHKNHVFAACSFILLLAMLPQNTFATVTVTAPALTVYACGGTFPTNSYTLGNIVISEGAKGDISTFGTLILTAPANFEFTSAGSGSFTAGNISGVNSTLTNATTITVTITGSGTNAFDIITLSGIQVRGLNAVNTGSITRTGGSSLISGDANGKVHATLTSAIAAYPAGTLSAAETSGTANNDNTICAGNSVSFTATSGFTTYTFKVNGSVVQSSAANTYNTTTLSNGQSVTADVTNASGCLATFGPVVINVSALPAISGTLSVCSGSNTQLTGSGTADVTSPWSSATPGVATVNSTGMVTGVSAGSAIITYKNNNGCTNTATVTVTAIPTTATIASAVLTACGSLVSGALGGNTPSAGTGLWSKFSGPGTVSFSNAASGSATATVSVTGTYVLRWTISNGSCMASTADVTVNYYNLPSAGTITVNRTGGKCGAKVTGSAVTCPDGSAPMYQWETRTTGGNPCTSPWTILAVTTDSSYIPADTALATKNRFRRLVICGSCQSSSYAPDCSGTAPVSNYMVVNATGSGVCATGQSGSGGIITVTVNGGIPTYQYSFNGGAFQPGNVFNTSALGAGTYPVQVKDSGDPPNGCKANANITLTALPGTVGTWTGAVSTDWFDCGNWGVGTVPVNTTAVNIPATSKNPVINPASTYIAAFPYAQSQHITLNDTLSFTGAAGKLLAAGNVTIAASGLLDMTNGGIVELQGNWNNQAVNGFKYGTGSIIFSGGNTQTLTPVNTTETFYDFEINKTAATNLLHLIKNVTVNHNLTLTQGIITTGNNLFTWNNSGGTLTAPEPAYSNASLNYTKSFIATCDAAGTPLTVTDAATAFAGNVGFKIKNTGSTDIYFPVGASYIPADNTYPVPAPNRMMINNQSGSPQDYTVIINYGDIGYTNGTENTWKINRIWHVKAEPAVAGKATMKLFFTKRDWTGWGPNENEVEAGFNYAQTALLQKDYSAGYGSFINMASGGDIQNFTQNTLYPYNTEIYGSYTIGVSNSLTNGIIQFNRFSVVNPGDIILPVALSNLKVYQKDNTIQVTWDAHNEISMSHYEIEKSPDGNSFIKTGMKPALNNGLPVNRYSFVDENPLQGNNFYRIKAFDKDGRVIYSTIVKVDMNTVNSYMVVMPNPVINKILNIRLNNIPAGRYNLTLYNVLGQPVLQKTIEHTGVGSMQIFNLPSSAISGVYTLRLLNKSLSFDTRIIVK